MFINNHKPITTTGTLWPQVLQTLVSIPERAANRMKDKIDKKFLPECGLVFLTTNYYRAYFRQVVNKFFDFAEALDKQARGEELWKASLVDVPIFSQTFDKISFIGHAGGKR